MPEVTVEINGRPFKIACGDGEQDHVKALAAQVDGHARGLSRGVTAQAAESKLMLMAGLMVADELHEARKEIDALKDQVRDLKIKSSAARAMSGDSEFDLDAIRAEAQAETEEACAELLDTASETLETLAQRLSGKAAQ